MKIKLIKPLSLNLQLPYYRFLETIDNTQLQNGTVCTFTCSPQNMHITHIPIHQQIENTVRKQQQCFPLCQKQN